MPSKKPVLLSGIQPTGRLHIGNYLGAIKNWVELQNSGTYECNFPIVDLHSLTENFDPKDKSGQILELIADLMAAGLDPKKSRLFLQSLVPAHSELAWVLSTITPMGELERMTQYKDKSGRQKENINVGLFAYPPLMAADIVLYNTKFVPTGDDQDQHLEFTRTIARKFNKKFGDTFVEPQGLHTSLPRVMSLKDPMKKMSKSDPDGCLFLDDSPEDIKKKIMRAVTDSDNEIRYDKEKKRGLSNLLEIYAALSDSTPALVEKKFSGKGYGELKGSLAALIADHFADFRKKKAVLMKKPATLKTVLLQGSKKADVIASKKIEEVRERMGLVV